MAALAWALAFYPLGANDPYFTMQGLVWSTLPQTPQAAEHVAMAAVSQIARAAASVFSDCLGLVRTATQSWQVKVEEPLSMLESGGLPARLQAISTSLESRIRQRTKRKR